MKDALGHGSQLHGGLPTQYNKGFSDSTRLAPGATFPSAASTRAQIKPGTAATVANMRQRLATADSPGRAAALLQGIKNLVGS